MTKSDIRVCSAWESGDDPNRTGGSGEHERPVYTLSTTCPNCGAEAINTAPASFDPADPYGKYRRRVRPEGPEA